MEPAMAASSIETKRQRRGGILGRSSLAKSSVPADRGDNVKRVKAPIAMLAIMYCMASPSTAHLFIGGLVLSPLRVFLLVATVPAILAFLARFQLRSWDYLFMFSVFWYMMCAVVHRGASGIEFGGIYFLQMAGVYFLVQAYTKNIEQITAVFKHTLVVIIILTPFAVHENFTGERFLQDYFGSVFGTQANIQSDQRFNLYRAATSFSHPILFGVFCATTFAFMWYSKASAMTRLIKTTIVGFATFTSLSSGGILAMMLQIGLIAGEYCTRWLSGRASWLFWAILGAYVFLELVANSGPFGVLANYFTFNPTTAYHRMAIWEFGIDDVKRSPLVGIPDGTWTRPNWMTSSVDNQWLLLAMRGGFPALFAMLIAIVLVLAAMMSAPESAGSDAYNRTRRACLYCLCGFLFAGSTVAFFEKMEPLFAFYVGLAAAIARMDPQTGNMRDRQSETSKARSVADLGDAHPASSDPADTQGAPAPDRPRSHRNLARESFSARRKQR